MRTAFHQVTIALPPPRSIDALRANPEFQADGYEANVAAIPFNAAGKLVATE
jgi:hypothetical protein